MKINLRICFQFKVFLWLVLGIFEMSEKSFGIVICVISILVIFAFFGIVQYQTLKTDQTNRLNVSSKSAATRLSLSLPSFIWSFDADTVKSSVESEMGEPALIGVSVIVQDTTKTVLVGFLKNEPSKTNILLKNMMCSIREGRLQSIGPT